MFRQFAISVLLLAASGSVAAVAQTGTANPHGALTSGLDCSSCHRTDGWRPIRDTLLFDHNRETDFALVGSHITVSCESCHSNLKFRMPEKPGSACDNCHVDVHQGAFPNQCAECHTPVSFDDVRTVEVHNRTRFPLDGSHEQLSCSSCHQTDEGGAFAPLETSCISCHNDDYDREHADLEFPVTCENCHSTTNWGDAGVFDHAMLAGGFELLGAHETTRCTGCHVPNSLQVIFPAQDQFDCVACHQTAYDQQHGVSGFPTACLDCHNVDRWEDATFDHVSLASGFQLLGAHNALPCSACHGPPPDLTPTFSPSSDQDCATCHQSDYQEEHGGSGFPTACLDCHNVDRWEDATFDHVSLASGFQLLGAHDALPCSACHGPPPDLTPTFNPSSDQDCATCHQSDYQEEHGGSGFPTACLDCHNVDRWEDATFDHVSLASGFQLLGAHDALPCSACHGPPPDLTPTFSPSSDQDCATCHQSDYQEEHGGSGFPTACLDCHNVDRWEDATFDHVGLASGFQLLGAHDALPCSACHGPPPELTPTFSPSSDQDCATCHQSDYQEEHGGSGFPTACLDCHNVDRWEDATFDHVSLASGFQLLGAHNALPCSACHGPPPDLTPTFNPSSDQDCATCHQSDYQEEHGGSGFPTACLDCHNVDRWEDATFDHVSLASGFQLLGAHDALPCSACHGPPPDLTPTFSPSSDQDCATCHQSDYQEEHGGSGFPTACLDCHNVDRWEDATFDHVSLASGFQLLGAHDALPCSACHGPPPDLTPTFNPSSDQDCATCHQSDYQEEHGGSGFPTACLDCHNVDRWEDATFDHVSLASGFQLLGAHDALPCSACHGPPPDLTPTFNPSSDQDCATCHQSDYQEEHGGSGFPTACLDCHNVDRWEDATFDHVGLANGFQLLGAHDALPCSACHGPPPELTPTFSPSSDQDCATCHQSDYQEEHGGSGFPTACLDCHNVDRWEDATFDHVGLANGFQLLGAHDALPCSACHGPPPELTPTFSPSSDQDCATCHQSDYQEEHGGSGFPTACLDCHNVDRWEDATFDHVSLASGFQLLGAHDALPCSACHGPPPDLTPTFSPSSDQDCATCHQSDYQEEHGGSGFPTACLDCHNVDRWEDATFDHVGLANGFQLLGAHDALPCSACHGPPPDLTPTFNPSSDQDCATCHQSDYQEEHGGSGFPTACLDCHNVDRWEDATFDHVSLASGFQLLGAHDALPCSACHGPPPDLTPTFNPSSDQDCATCHQSDYQEEHGGSGFPTACLDCHNVDRWEDATFDHVSLASGFQLLGAHDALPCSACHGPPPDLTPTFSPSSDQDCATCHQSDYQEEHGGSGFPTACLDCHNVDRWEDATFDHVGLASGFQLLGAHDALPCSACHGPPPELTPTFSPSSDQDCATCHQSDYQEEHGGSGFPTACLDCHNVDRWEDATFDHDNAYFPIYQGPHDGKWTQCQECHPQPQSFSVFTCLTCHEHNKLDVDDDHSEVQDYVYESTACLSCHPQGDH